VPADLEAVDPGHVDIEQHQVRDKFAQPLERFFAIRRFPHVEVELAQRFLFQQAHHVVVVDDQHNRPSG
jgi:hypothetical protein